MHETNMKTKILYDNSAVNLEPPAASVIPEMFKI